MVSHVSLTTLSYFGDGILNLTDVKNSKNILQLNQADFPAQK
jgi:hypothetical protein